MEEGLRSRTRVGNGVGLDGVSSSTAVRIWEIIRDLGGLRSMDGAIWEEGEQPVTLQRSCHWEELLVVLWCSGPSECLHKLGREQKEGPCLGFSPETMTRQSGWFHQRSLSSQGRWWDNCTSESWGKRSSLQKMGEWIYIYVFIWTKMWKVCMEKRSRTSPSYQRCLVSSCWGVGLKGWTLLHIHGKECPLVVKKEIVAECFLTWKHLYSVLLNAKSQLKYAFYNASHVKKCMCSKINTFFLSMKWVTSVKECLKRWTINIKTGKILCSRS